MCIRPNCACCDQGENPTAVLRNGRLEMEYVTLCHECLHRMGVVTKEKCDKNEAVRSHGLEWYSCDECINAIRDLQRFLGVAMFSTPCRSFRIMHFNPDEGKRQITSEFLSDRKLGPKPGQYLKNHINPKLVTDDFENNDVDITTLDCDTLYPHDTRDFVKRLDTKRDAVWRSALGLNNPKTCKRKSENIVDTTKLIRRKGDNLN